MLKIYNESNGELIGEINAAEFQFLKDMLEEESSEDVDYFIDEATIDMLEVRGGDPDLVTILRKAVADSEGIEITWENPE